MAPLNAAGVALALALSAGASLRFSSVNQESTPGSKRTPAALLVNTPEGPALRDATGAVVVVKNYQRIVGGSLVADRLLLELAEPARVLASLDSSRATAWGFRITAPHTLSEPTNAERLLALKPDLVILSDLGEASKVQRLRELGLAVFVLGPMRGRATLLPQIQAISMLLGAPARGEALSSAFRARSERVAVSVPKGKRLRALYVGAYGDKMFGGTRGTSYHDVLEMAGLVDAAESKFEGWPQYSPEQVLSLDPDVLVTTTTSAKNLCEQTGLQALRACRAENGVVALNEGLMSDPGLAMLDAAEAVFEAVYGTRH
ncbi:MAG: ABC transporter substrate-binding protein [Polyangiaceae bacterium]|nr:ABC transporter substrate-binding protein [Polyangiaceae bacterium]